MKRKLGRRAPIAAYRAPQGLLSSGTELLEGDLREHGQRHPGGVGDEFGELDAPVPFVHFRDAPAE
jgi:hypothetical protein